ncbi:MAG TPA: hypothetical protein VFB78_01090 [Acidimicrobiales bacterium]|nr:hypothetical protein [Acidimicrobiales bacterium]
MRQRLVGTMVGLAAASSLIVAARSAAQVPPVTIPSLTTTIPPPPPPASTAPPDTISTDTTEAPPDTTELPTVTTVVADVTEPLIDTPTTAARTAPLRTRPALTKVGALRAASVSGAYGIGFAGVLAVALALTLLATLIRSQLIPGGSPMNARRRARLLAGSVCLAIAALAGLIGYLKLSLETDVNRQIPYLASAGMVLVLLSAIGGALIVGEQMRTDTDRIDELEAAVQKLAAMVAPSVEAPARTKRATTSRRS